MTQHRLRLGTKHRPVLTEIGGGALLFEDGIALMPADSGLALGVDAEGSYVRASSLSDAGTLSWTDELVVGRDAGHRLRTASLSVVRDIMNPTKQRNVPSYTDFSWVNQDDATVEDVPGFGFLMYKATEGNTVSHSALVRPVPVGSSWSVTVGLEFGAPSRQHYFQGLFVRNAANGKCLGIGGCNYAGQINHRQYQLTDTGTTPKQETIGWSGKGYLSISWDGTTYTFWHSADGISWVNLATSVLATYITDAADQWGVSMTPQDAGGVTLGYAYCGVFHWSEE